MAKIKNRDRRKKQAQRKRNQERQQKRDDGEFVKSFTGYMQLTFKRETDDETIRKNVIRCDDWLKNSYQIFKNPRRYLVVASRSLSSIKTLNLPSLSGPLKPR